MNPVAREKIVSENSMKFHNTESLRFLTGACQIVNPPAVTSLVGRASCPSVTDGQAGSLSHLGLLNMEQPPVLLFSHGDQRVGCSYILDAGYRIDTSSRQREKSRLIRNLLGFVGTSQEQVSEAPAATSEIQIISGSLGKPELYVDGHEGPSVSFSHTEAATWGALCWTGGIVGIDVAFRDEFPDNYPFHRAFHDEELSNALEITDGNISEAAALLWTAKEAVVKCVGTGFLVIDPLELRIAASARLSEKDHCTVCFDDKVFGRLPELAESSIGVLTLMKESVGVSVAIMVRNGAADFMIPDRVTDLFGMRRNASSRSVLIAKCCS